MLMPIGIKLLAKASEPKQEGTTQDYTGIWYCVRLAGADKFPDGKSVPVKKWRDVKPIWVKLGEGVSWAKAITFGPVEETTVEAAKAFGAKRIVWLDEKNKTAVPENSQDFRSGKERGAA